MNNRWKNIRFIAWIMLAVVLAFGSLFPISENKENESVKAEIALNKTPALVSAGTKPSDKEGSSTDSNSTNDPNADYFVLTEGVTYQMCNADFWKAKIRNTDIVLKTPEEIAAFNRRITNTGGTNMYNLNEIKSEFNGDSLKNTLATNRVPINKLYKNGEEMSEQNKKAYFNEIKNNIRNAQTSQNDTLQYAIVSKRADLKTWPTADYIGYSEADTDEELTVSSLNINEPFVVKVITGDGQFAWGYSTVCTGWVNTDNLAFCKDKEEWNDAWNMTDNNFLVVTADRLTLEPSNLTQSTSGMKLMLGTKLKLVPKDKIPEMVGERSPINNYVVYVPLRSKNGKYVKGMALISQNKEDSVHVGYVPMTTGNLLDLAFNCLGDRYGWGGMLESMDCSSFTRTIYSCCGLELPRNTTWQTLTPSNNYTFNFDTGQDDQKKEILKDLLPGALLKFNGHIAIYVGHDNGEYYAISAVGSFVNPSGDVTIKNINSIVLTPLSVRRANGYTWLTNITDFIVPWDFTIANQG